MNNTHNLIPVQVIALLEERISHSPVVLLLDKEQNRVLPIWIGEFEARSIVVGLHKVSTPRPLTHQLLVNMMKGLNAKPEKVVVDKLENNTFFATVHVNQLDQIVKIDARPSDAIAIALECQVPIYVSEEIMQLAGQDNPLTVEMTEKIAYGEFGSSPEQKKQPEKKLTEEEMEKLKNLLEEARKREEKGGA